MIDAQPGDLAGAQQLEGFVVDGGEHLRLLDANGGEVVDVEEAPVVDLLGGHAPERQAVRLIGEQCFQPVEAVGGCPSRR